ncbi:MAG TPA: metallophosphoesterase [Verrucomicrobiae bacterium]|nr:metallophosphoesterase [Verrucomicrobiae bacterium]
MNVPGFTRRRFMQGGSAALLLPRLGRAAALIRQPYLQNVQSDRASILWTADAAGLATVTVSGPDGGSITATARVQVFQPSQTLLASSFYQYCAEITGLLPATEYTYCVTVDGRDLASDPAQFRFQTAPLGDFAFLAFGDSGACTDEQQTLIRLMSAETGVSMVLHLGDLAYSDGTFEQFESGYYDLNAPLMRRLPFFPTPGNHDYNTGFAAPYLAGIVTPECGVAAPDQGRYYSFDWGCAHLVSLDSNLLASSSASQMLAWLDRDLAAAAQRWRIAFLHHTPYPTGFHLGDPLCLAVQQHVNPILERHGVQLLLAGHEHGYERTHPLASGRPVGPGAASTVYVVSGGGGGALESVGSSPQCALSVQAFHYLRVDVEPQRLTFSAVGLDGGIIDRVRLGQEAGIVIDSVLSKGDYIAAVAPGSLVSISGSNLAGRTEVNPSDSCRTEMSGSSVKVAGLPAPLLYVSPTQIQAQIPYEVAGPVPLDVAVARDRVYTNITVSPTAPSLLGIMVGNAPFSATNPARPGGRVSLYVTGLGLIHESVRSGSAPVKVWLGEQPVGSISLGLARGFTGVHRLDLEIPPDLEDGIYAISVIAGDAASRPANLDVVRNGTAYRRNRARTRVHVRTPGPSPALLAR